MSQGCKLDPLYVYEWQLLFRSHEEEAKGVIWIIHKLYEHHLAKVT
jgi:hypothetical protein